MNKTALLGAILSTAILISPVAASAQKNPTATASLANTVAATGTATDATSKAASAAPEEKKICKQLPSSYSRMTKRSCLTAKEWKQVEQDSQD